VAGGPVQWCEQEEWGRECDAGDACTCDPRYLPLLCGFVLVVCFFCKVAALSPEAGPEPRRGDSQRQAGACAQRRARVHGMSWRHNCHASSAAPPDGDKNRDLNNYAALVFKSYSSGIRPYSEVFAVYSGFSLLLTLCVY